MSESITITFSGGIADQHRMDFYEAARFQYAFSRLAVKLDQFRATGTFQQKVTKAYQSQIDLIAQEDGSFRYKILVPTMILATVAAKPILIETSLTAMFSYVIERVFTPADDDKIIKALETQNNLISTFNKQIEASDNANERALELLEEQIRNNKALNDENRALYERLKAESDRRNLLDKERAALQKITAEQDAKLVTMATPLLKELSVPLRRSADRADIGSTIDGVDRVILSADYTMASAIEAISIDPEITPVRINIVQYNKENGWGKFRGQDFEKVSSFQVPGDRKGKLQAKITAAMNAKEVLVQAYYVRSKSDVPVRIILIGFLDIDKIERGEEI